eukprot:TRINITY_DN22551_c0_g1_i2.p1 TRINITY_DN22551_c0_g1~~TRINITY_DN22551_c0_g1_i2.p1  ORF type:complete len:252 (+),score=43.88 TRINITY_DN22551_c0_g1_i2:112-867(+)
MKQVTFRPPTKNTKKPVENAKDVRNDGRVRTDMRPMFMKTGIVTQATGSAYLELNNTKVVVAVYGPRQKANMEFSETGRIHCEFKYASFSDVSVPRSIQESENKTFSLQMLQALQASVIVERFPKSLLDVTALVIESDGGALGVAITCASLALANAGIEMYDLVASCSVAQIGTQMRLDPVAIEEKQQSAAVTVAYMPSLNEVTQLRLDGEMEFERAQDAIDLGIDGCVKIHQLMKQHLLTQALPSTTISE